MLAKLTREISRLEKSKNNKEELVDTGLNCALTAWHIVDWVWREHFYAKPETWKQFGVTQAGGWRIPDPFRTSLTKQCQELEFCEGLANNIKHAVVITFDSRTSARSTPVGAWSEYENGVIGGQLPGGAGAVEVNFEYVLKISDNDNDGADRYAKDVFLSVKKFWSEFMDEHRIG